jgi:hypothetical protein
MRRSITILAFILLASGCSRNDEYRYIRELNPLVPPQTLQATIRQRLITSEFRKSYDQTLSDRIGSSFTNFKHIRAYQRVLDDTLVYIMLKTGKSHLDGDLRNKVIQTASIFILNQVTGQEFIAAVDRIAGYLQDNDDPVPALDRLAEKWKT